MFYFLIIPRHLDWLLQFSLGFLSSQNSYIYHFQNADETFMAMTGKKSQFESLNLSVKDLLRKMA